MGQVRARGIGAPLAGEEPAGQRRLQGQYALLLAGASIEVQPVGRERQLDLHDVGRGPAGLRDPAPRPAAIARGRRHAVLHPHLERRLLLHPRVAPLEPLVPPAQALLQKADGRPRLAQVRVLVAPGADQPLAAVGKVSHQALDGVGVAVRPAADRQHRHLHPGEVLADRAVAPVGVAVRVLEPGGEPQPAALQAPVPHRPPRLADHAGIRRQGVVGEHGRGPGEVVPQQAAAHVVDVVGIAIVGGADADHRAELGGLAGRQLQAVEAAPGDADHADSTVAPGLSGQPAQDRLAVEELLLQVLVGEHPPGIAAAAEIDAYRGIAVAGEVVVVLGVAPRRAVAQPVGNVLEDGRHRPRVGAHRQPEPPAQRDAVVHGDPHRIVTLHAVGKVGDDTHGLLLC